jgi:hypothetical protein
MKQAEEIAKSIVDQWDNHDRYRTTDGEKLLFSNGIEPDDVCVARALLVLLYPNGKGDNNDSNNNLQSRDANHQC